ncbi:MAG: hypothetical protein A2V91_00590 [Candidatus Muproteobacteria bacterium RBG_16_64_10]|uniref:DUF1841 domain-containing protein n=1 Tax=Candidatus Muproteobacteria bacterium RBG_16_64_10 TaxID=1817757 RepID=A0A1F6SVM3_9PROT|nr:MAG: hypothetical protein A2V91_00590 [Candidatus Muproteobacteria bacterium RBG_16_64_10]
MFFGQDRRQLREVFFRAWQRHRENLPLEGVEPLIVTVALRHPEYHPLLEAASRTSLSRGPRLDPIADDQARYEDRDYSPENGQTNPFLHLGMHIAIEEQLALDQPRGIRAQYQRLLTRLADEHAVQHHIMECLGEWLWRAGREDAPLSETVYLDCIARRAGNS